MYCIVDIVEMKYITLSFDGLFFAYSSILLTFFKYTHTPVHPLFSPFLYVFSITHSVN